MSMRVAIQDVIDGVKNYEFWMTFGLNDIRAKYRRSKLGQWWITLSVAIFIVVIGGLYRGVFNADAGNYMAYLAIGYITWLFIQSSVNMGCNALAQARPFLLQKAWPKSVFVFRAIYREFLTFLHHVVLLIPIFLWLRLWPGFGGIVLGVLGFVLIVFTAFWVVITLSVVSVRFRDFPPIVQSLMRMAFFATPIVWTDRHLGTFGEWVLLLNPFGYYLKIVRDPLLGNSLTAEDYWVPILLTLLSALVALLVLERTRDKLNYWL